MKIIKSQIVKIQLAICIILLAVVCIGQYSLTKANKAVDSLNTQLQSAEQQLQVLKASEIDNKSNEYNSGLSLVEITYILNMVDSQDSSTDFNSINTMLNRDSTIDGDTESGNYNVYYKIQGNDAQQLEINVEDNTIKQASIVVTTENGVIKEELQEDLLLSIIENCINKGSYSENEIQSVVENLNSAA